MENNINPIYQLHPELIASTVCWMRFGTINILTGKSENVQEIHFDSQSEIIPSKS